MSNVIEILKNYYKPVDEAQRSRAFFFSLADYVNHIETTPELKGIIQDIMKEKEELLKEKDKYEAKAKQELQESKRIILKVVSKVKKAIPKLNEELKELESFEKSTTDEYSRADHLEMRLWDVGMVLYQSGYKKELKPLIDDKTDNPNVYLDYKRFRFSPSLIEKRRLNTEIEKLRENRLWGCWDYLRLVPVILLAGKEFNEVISTRDIGMLVIYIELREIFETRNKIWGEMTSLPPQIPPEEAREMLKYRLYVSRIHNYLLEKLPEKQKSEELIKLSPEIYGMGINLKALCKKLWKKLSR